MNKDLTTLFTGRTGEILEETGSTNAYLISKLKTEKLPEGTAIRTMKQNAGRGQAGTSWESEAGKNLLVSFVFYPEFLSPRNLFQLNQSFALAIHDFVNDWLPANTTIKWPNDIYWKNKKIAGLLIENSISASTVSQTIFGVGININQQKFSGSLPNPVSFKNITGKDYDLNELFNSLCGHIESRYLSLRNGAKYLNEEYLEVLYTRGEWKYFEVDGKKMRASIHGVDESGKLIVMNEAGEFGKYDLKEIKLIPD